MFNGFYGGCGRECGRGCGGFGWNNCGPNWGWGRGWAFGGACEKCGHCCGCNFNHHMFTLGLAAMRCCCEDGRRGFFDGGEFRGPGFGGVERKEKEHICEDLRTYTHKNDFFRAY